MTDRDVLSLAERVLGVMWLIFSASRMREAALTVSYILQHNISHSLAVAACVSPVLTLLLALALLLFSNHIARLLVPRPTSVGEDWQRWLFSTSARVIGLVLLLQGIMGVWDIIMKDQITASSLNHGKPLGSALITPGRLVTTATLAISAYLLTGAKHLVRTLYPQLLPNDGNEQH